MLKKTVFLIIILLLLSNFGCTQKSNKVEIIQPEISYTDKKVDLNTVANDLTKAYLDQFLKENMDVNEKLNSYEIKEIKVMAKNRSSFVYTVKYNMVKNNTTEEKYMFVTVMQNENTFKIDRWEANP